MVLCQPYRKFVYISNYVHSYSCVTSTGFHHSPHSRQSNFFFYYFSFSLHFFSLKIPLSNEIENNTVQSENSKRKIEKLRFSLLQLSTYAKQLGFPHRGWLMLKTSAYINLVHIFRMPLAESLNSETIKSSRAQDTISAHLWINFDQLRTCFRFSLRQIHMSIYMCTCTHIPILFKTFTTSNDTIEFHIFVRWKNGFSESRSVWTSKWKIKTRKFNFSKLEIYGWKKWSESVLKWNQQKNQWLYKIMAFWRKIKW